MQIKAPHSEEKGENKESGCTGYANQGPAKGRRRARITRTDAEAIQIKGPQKEEKGENNESGCRCYGNQGRTQGGYENKESGCRGYTNQSPAI